MPNLQYIFKYILIKNGRIKNIKNAILMAIQESFQKTYGKRYHWTFFINQSKTIKNMLKDNMKLSLSSDEDMSKFYLQVQKAVIDSDLYRLIKGYNPKTSQPYICLDRKLKFPEVKDYVSLVREVQKYPGGIVVDGELLKMTYKGVISDINKAITCKDLTKIYNENPNEDFYFLFPNLMEKEYEINISSQESKQRLELIQQITRNLNSQIQANQSINQVKQLQENALHELQKQKDNSDKDLNYRLPNYVQNKKRWKQYQNKIVAGEYAKFNFMDTVKEVNEEGKHSPKCQKLQDWEILFRQYQINNLINQKEERSLNQEQNVSITCSETFGQTSISDKNKLAEKRKMKERKLLIHLNQKNTTNQLNASDKRKIIKKKEKS